MELGKIILPISIDKTPQKKLSFRNPTSDEEEYYDNVECMLRFDFIGTLIIVDYYGEDDTLLSELFTENQQPLFKFDTEKDDWYIFQHRLLTLLYQH